MENSITLIPTFKEFILFITITLLLIILCTLYHNNNIQIIVNRVSRCLKNKKLKNTTSDVYTITMINNKKEPLYDITYDLKRKIYTTDCKMPKGNVVNEIPIKIPVYDFINKKTSDEHHSLPVCYADKHYTQNSLMPVSYTGYGPLLDFIETDGVLNYVFDESNNGEKNGCPVKVINAVTKSYVNEI